MKMRLISLLTLGRTLDHARDRSGVYSLRKVNEFSKLGSARTVGTPPAASAVTVAAPVAVAQPLLFDGAEASAPAPARAPATKTVESETPMKLVPVPPPEVKVAAPRPAPNPDRKSLWQSAKKPLLDGCAAAMKPVIRTWGKLRRPAADLRPRAQAELALEKVTVLRNDLSEADVTVVAPERNRGEPRERKPATGPNPWKEATARWINLKSPAEKATGATATTPRAPSTELSRTSP
jgi:hypothetical protein